MHDRSKSLTASARARRMRRATVPLFAAAVLAGASSARAQIATLDKGHSIFLNNGLQIWGFDSATRYGFDYNTLAAGNMNAVVWGNGGTDMSTLSAGQKWGKWTDWQYN